MAARSVGCPPAMSTRRLIITALVCGLAILIAGGIQLVRVADSRRNAFDPLDVGQQVQLTGVTARVVSFDRADGVVQVRVAMSVADDAAPVPDVDGAWALRF